MDFPVVFYYCGLMIAFYLLSSLLAYILSVLMIRLSQKVVFQMREDVFRRLVELPRLVEYTPRGQTCTPYNTIYRVLETSDLLLIYISKMEAHILDKSAAWWIHVSTERISRIMASESWLSIKTG